MRLIAYLGTVVLLGTGTAWSQELNFRAIASKRPISVATADPIPLSLGRPQPIAQPAPPSETFAPAAQASFGTYTPRRVVRGQMPGDVTPPIAVPPPPRYPGAPGSAPAVFPGSPPGIPLGGSVGGPVRPGEEAYNCGRINNDADQGNFFERTGDRFRRCWTDITEGIGGGFSPTSNRTLFMSDHCFDQVLISPVTNPHRFEDPRALTELRPIFMWQRTPSNNPQFAGSNNYFATLQGRVAFTDNISLVVNRLGWADVNVPFPAQGISSDSGLTELLLGPKFTFIRNQDTNTVAALGLTFEIPIGQNQIGQGTGNLSLAPYFSFAQNFLRSDYGSFNFMNTTGYSFGVDSQRTDNFFASFHLDYDLLNLHRFYPLIELNWTYYPFNGDARFLGYEGNHLYNFGSNGVAGRHDLTVAGGFRYKFNDNIQFGVAGEFNVLPDSDRHLDKFRLTVDLIFRY